jgi:predicted nuclease of predicted toxin-antitoxin system
MKFLVDAHLPPALCVLLREAGHDSLHTLELPNQNRTADSFLNQLSMTEQRALITKDTDFYHSHLLHGRPWKLLLVRTGNARTRDLTALFARHLDEILAALDTHTLVELDWHSVRPIS